MTSRRTSTVPRSKKPKPLVSEPDIVGDDQLSDGIKHERCGSAKPDEEPQKKRKSPGQASKDKFYKIVAIDFGMSGCGKLEAHRSENLS